MTGLDVLNKSAFQQVIVVLIELNVKNTTLAYILIYIFAVQRKILAALEVEKSNRVCKVEY